VIIFPCFGIYPLEVILEKGNGNLPKESKAKADQIRTIDKSRCVSIIGELENEHIRKIYLALT
jgi:mRNA interferase MazF